MWAPASMTVPPTGTSLTIRSTTASSGRPISEVKSTHWASRMRKVWPSASKASAVRPPNRRGPTARHASPSQWPQARPVHKLRSRRRRGKAYHSERNSFVRLARVVRLSSTGFSTIAYLAGTAAKPTFLHASLIIGGQANTVSLRFAQEVGGITESFWIEAAIPAVVVIEAILDEATVIDHEAAVDQDLFVLGGNRELPGLAAAVVDPDIEQDEIAGLVWNLDRVPAEEIRSSIPAGRVEDRMLPRAGVPHLLHLEANSLPERSFRPFRRADEGVRLEMRFRLDIQAPAVFFRIVLQIERKANHPIALFPMDLAATLFLPGGRILVPAPKAVEDGKRLRHEEEVVACERLHQLDEPFVEE